MKYRYIRFKFKEPLTTEQEAILYVNLDEVTEGIARKFKAMQHELEQGWGFKLATASGRLLPGMDASAATKSILLAFISSVLIKLSLYAYKEKEDGRTYRFVWAHDELALAKFKHMRVSPINETLLIDGMKRFVFSDMKINTGDVEISKGEFDKTPFGETKVPEGQDQKPESKS